MPKCILTSHRASCQFQVISVTIVGFSFFKWRVPTILSTSVYILFIHTHIHSHTHAYTGTLRVGFLKNVELWRLCVWPTSDYCQSHSKSWVQLGVRTFIFFILEFHILFSVLDEGWQIVEFRQLNRSPQVNLWDSILWIAKDQKCLCLTCCSPLDIQPSWSNTDMSLHIHSWRWESASGKFFILVLSAGHSKERKEET